MKYMKKGSIVEAIQFSREKALEYLKCGNLPMGIQIVANRLESGELNSFEVLSFGLSGISKAIEGDWLVLEDSGNKYFIKNECFLKNFIELSE